MVFDNPLLCRLTRRKPLSENTTLSNLGGNFCTLALQSDSPSLHDIPKSETPGAVTEEYIPKHFFAKMYLRENQYGEKSAC